MCITISLTVSFELWDTILADYLGGRGIEYALEIVPWGGYAEKYLTAISSRTGPDVGYMYMEMIADFIEMGALAPMDEFITDDMRDRYIYLDNGVMMGAQYAFPFVVGNPRIMYYNRDILEANGITEPPSTWEGFVEAAKKIDIDPRRRRGTRHLPLHPGVERAANRSAQRVVLALSVAGRG